MQCVIPPGKKSLQGKPTKAKGFEQVIGIGEKPGEEYAALNALHQLERGKPLERVLPPEFRDLWIDMDKRFADAKEAEKKAAFRAEKSRKIAERKAKAAKNAESATISISVASRDAIDDALHGQSGGGPSGSAKVSFEGGTSESVKRELVRFGFSPQDAEAAAARFGDVNEALEFLCLNLDESELPPSFAPSADVEVVQFHKSAGASAGRRIDAALAERLADMMSASRLAAEKSLRASDGVALTALCRLFRMLTASSFEAHSESLDDVASSERAIEQEALEAIYSEDILVGNGTLKEFPGAWAVLLTLERGIPGLSVDQAVRLAVVDVDGLYPFSPPALFVTPIRGNMSRAQRRVAMRAAAAAVENARSNSLGSSILEPVHVVHTALSFLVESSEAELLAAAASCRPAPGGTGTVPSVSSSPPVNAKPKPARQTKESTSGNQKPKRPRWRTPKPVAASRAKPEALRAMSEKRQRLPAFKSRGSIIDVIRGNQVTVVSGATGSGKTTQVPQFLLEDASQSRTPISIVCTQPRRIAAMSVAERVAAERCERIGESVGYQVKLNTKRSDDTRLVFCTTGVLLRQMQSDPELEGVTHLLVDEVHERSVETDFVLLLVRDILRQRPSLRVVLMSATLDASKFSSYFGSHTGQPVPIISIPGRTFPVTELFLEDAVALTKYRLRPGDRYAKRQWGGGRNGASGGPFITAARQSATEAAKEDDPDPRDDDSVPDDWDDDTDCDEDLPALSQGPTPSAPGGDAEISSGHVPKSVVEANAECVKLIDEAIVNIDLLDMLVRKLDLETRDGSAGAILVFLPGMAEISGLVERLSRGPGSSRIFPMPLHSAISPDEQSAVFGRPPKGRRKVICSTNIAETSVTVEDVTIVLDTTRVKEMTYDALNGTSVLAETFVSKAAARQRTGRAGRVSKGTCYRMVRQATFENKFSAQQEPEIRRVSLEHLVLNLLSITPTGFAARDPHEFLAKAMDPPSRSSISAAVSNLSAIGALEAVKKDGQKREKQQEASNAGPTGLVRLTALGRHLSGLPVDARIGKLLIYGALFGCLDSALTIAATLAERSPFFSPRDKRDEANRAREEFKWGQSDLLMYVRAFNSWCDARAAGGFRAQKDFCEKKFLSRKTLLAIGDARSQLRGALFDAGFGETIGAERGANDNNKETRIVRAVICASLYPNVIRIDPPETKYEAVRGGAVAKDANSKDHKMRGRTGERVFLHPESINFKEGNYGSRWLAYFSKVQTSRVFIRDSSVVSPYAMLMFGGDIDVRYGQNQLTIDGWIVFKAPERVGAQVNRLRSSLDDLLQRKFDSPALDVRGDSEALAVSDAILRLISTES